MNRTEYIQSIVPTELEQKRPHVEVFAPINIALIKYWGKRDKELMLPYNSSLSVTLNKYGTKTSLSISEENMLLINGELIDRHSEKSKRVFDFLNLLCGSSYRFRVDTQNSIPTASGLASSASAFASFTKAIDEMFGLALSNEEMANVARIGSVSAGRSLHEGFVYMNHKNTCTVRSINSDFNDFCIGFCILSNTEKKHTSRDNMEYTVSNSVFYESWLDIVERDLQEILPYIQHGNFDHVGKIAERNALSMHASIGMLYEPDRFYLTSQSLQLIQRVQSLRKSGLSVYCTMDAGPNVKLMFQQKDLKNIKNAFPELSFYENICNTQSF